MSFLAKVLSGTMAFSVPDCAFGSVRQGNCFVPKNGKRPCRKRFPIRKPPHVAHSVVSLCVWCKRLGRIASARLERFMRSVMIIESQAFWFLLLLVASSCLLADTPVSTAHGSLPICLMPLHDAAIWLSYEAIFSKNHLALLSKQTS
jgi:hypothetical protein